MEAGAILREHGLSRTRNRSNIIYALDQSDVPLSSKEICSILSEKCDRSTVHRTLNSLFEKRLVQRVIVDHEVKYALNDKVLTGRGHANDHLHFKCSNCERLYCLTDVEVENYALPEGFTGEENQFLVIGKCNECQH